MRRWQDWWQTLRWRNASTPSHPTLEIHIPISPTPLFFNMLRCLACSLRRNGGVYRDAPIIATVGDARIDSRLARRLSWLKPLGVELRWLRRRDFAARDYFATGHQRWKYAYESDVVLLLDADILIAGPLDELVQSVYERNVVAGMIAHCCPFERAGQHHMTWDIMYRHCQAGAPRLEHEHTGWGWLSSDPGRRNCPAYFNYGVVCAPRSFCSSIGLMIDGVFDQVREIAPSVYAAQVALAVAIGKLKIPAVALPMRWNFANAPELEAMHAAELSHARILHMLGAHQFDKGRVFASATSLEDFVRAPSLSGINAQAQEVLREILPDLLAEDRAATRSAA